MRRMSLNHISGAISGGESCTWPGLAPGKPATATRTLGARGSVAGQGPRKTERRNVVLLWERLQAGAGVRVRAD